MGGRRKNTGVGALVNWGSNVELSRHRGEVAITLLTVPVGQRVGAAKGEAVTVRVR